MASSSNLTYLHFTCLLGKRFWCQFWRCQIVDSQ